MKEMTKEILRAAGFNERVEDVEKGLCPICKKVVEKDEFTDELSKKEYNISGMCQKCQDDIFSDKGE